MQTRAYMVHMNLNDRSRFSHCMMVMGQVGQATIVMARVLGLLWMRNPLRIVYQGEQKAPVPACGVRAGRRQSNSCKKGEARRWPLRRLLTSSTADAAP